MYRIGFVIIGILLFSSCEKKDTTTPNIVPEPEIEVDVSNCVPAFADDKLEIATWNIKFFPLLSSTRATLVELLPQMNVDIIAVQEISSMSQFRQLADEIEGWSGVVQNVFGDIELGFLYRDAFITSISTPELRFPGDGYGFPREAVEVDITHANGLTVKLINVHLKCCNDGEERRVDASNKLKEYMDVLGANEHVVLLGDFNDDIDNGSPFTNFLEDQEHYFFADQSIADGSSSDWSYLSWPSHIDHILCTDDLMDNFESVQTLSLDDCVTNYEGVISDHRPVVAVFTN